MEIMKLPITIYRDEDGWYVVECPVIPGCMSQGETEATALANIQEAIQVCLEVRRELKMPLFLENREIEIPVYALDSFAPRIGARPASRPAAQGRHDCR